MIAELISISLGGNTSSAVIPTVTALIAAGSALMGQLFASWFSKRQAELEIEARERDSKVQIRISSLPIYIEALRRLHEAIQSLLDDDHDRQLYYQTIRREAVHLDDGLHDQLTDALLTYLSIKDDKSVAPEAVEEGRGKVIACQSAIRERMRAVTGIY